MGWFMYLSTVWVRKEKLGVHYGKGNAQAEKEMENGEGV